MARERAGTGEFRSSVTDGEILAFIREGDRPFQSSRDVAEEFGLERSSAFRRLDQLAADERLSKGKAGAARVWWLTDEERSRGGSADPLRELVGLIDDAGAERVRERSREFRERFTNRMDRRRTDRANHSESTSEE